VNKSIDTLRSEFYYAQRVQAHATHDYKRYHKHFGASHRLVAAKWRTMMDAHHAETAVFNALMDAYAAEHTRRMAEHDARMAAYDARVAARRS